jgi:hypothetical protein
MKRPRIPLPNAAWFMIAAAILALYLFSGCVHTPPKSDEIGTAVECVWLFDRPLLCAEDPNRLTMDIDTYYKLMDELQKNVEEEYHRRQL